MNSRNRTEQTEIIADTKEYLLVYKPAGLAVESRSLTEPDLERLLRGRNPAGGPLFVINRLDQVVEGLVLFARTKKAAADLSAQIQSHRMEKEYLAAVDGVPKEKEAELTDWLLKDGRTNVSRVVPEGTPGAKEARLAYVCLRSDAETSLLKIRLFTGRHHQIRVQLANAGLPIIGDRKYNPAAKTDTDQNKYRFPALCCCALSFDEPGSGKRVDYRIEPRGATFG